MGFVESVIGEKLDGGEYLCGFFPFDATVLDTTVDENIPVFLDFLLFLLSYRSAHQVRVGAGIARDVGQDANDLFLIDDNTVSFLEDSLQGGMNVFDGFFAVFAGHVVVDELHRARTVQRKDSDDILEFGGFKGRENVSHAGTFHLKDARDFPCTQQIIDGRVMEGNVFGAELNSADCLDVVQCLLDDGQSGQTQEVDFKQADLLQAAHFVLGHRCTTFRAFSWPLQRGVVDQRLIGNDHPCCVC